MDQRQAITISDDAVPDEAGGRRSGSRLSPIHATQAAALVVSGLRGISLIQRLQDLPSCPIAAGNGPVDGSVIPGGIYRFAREE